MSKKADDRNTYRGFEIQEVDGAFVFEFNGHERSLPSERAAMMVIDGMANSILRNYCDY